MTGDEVRSALAELGLNQVEAARAFGVDARTMRRWVADGIEASPAPLAFRAIMLLPPSKREAALSPRSKEAGRGTPAASRS